MAAPGRLIGRSSHVSVTLTSPVVWPAAIGRGVVGGHAFFEKVRAEKQKGDCFLKAPSLGDLALLDLDGHTKYNVRPASMTASSATITTQMAANGLGSVLLFFSISRVGRVPQADVLSAQMAGGLYTYQVGGRGTLVLHANGGIYRIALGEGEKYFFDPRFYFFFFNW